MNEFRTLREAAASKRDAAIKAAKREYAITVEKIAELEGRIKGRRKPRARAKSQTTLADLIYAQLPYDLTLSVDDVCGLVKSAEPERERTRATIITNLNRMARSGSIKRVRMAKTGKPVLYAMADFDVLEAKTMLDWAKDIEGWREMKPVELMVQMVENGYEMDVPPKDAVRSLERELLGVR